MTSLRIIFFNYVFLLLPLTNSAQNKITIDTIITITKVEDNYPAWSPDGKTIAFHSNRHIGSPDIYVMDIMGKISDD